MRRGISPRLGDTDSHHAILGHRDPSQAHKIIDFLAQRLRFVASERPVIVHLFSNNGFFAYASLLRHPLSGDVLRSNVCAQIFDSSPGVPEPLSAKEFGIMFQRALEGIFVSRGGQSKGHWSGGRGKLRCPLSVQGQAA